MTRTYDADGTITATPFPGNIIPAEPDQSDLDEVPGVLPAAESADSTLGPQPPDPQGRPINKDQFILRMDFNESANSQWFGRYSWGDENQLSQALYLNGFQVLTNVEQYMGSNVRVLIHRW